MDVGGHTVNHAVLSNLPLPAARHEIVGCHEMIAERLGSRRCAPPERLLHAGRAARGRRGRFRTGLTTEDRENTRGGDPYAMSRKVLWENSTLGPLSYSAALAICNLDSVFHARARAPRLRRAPRRAARRRGRARVREGTSGVVISVTRARSARPGLAARPSAQRPLTDGGRATRGARTF